MIDVSRVVEIACEAGNRIMDIYRNDFAIYEKNDQSPLTEADLKAHEYIVTALQQLTPDIPVLSEESTGETHSQRIAWQQYWLVDPLDGTKEFIKKNGEFTVNIALIEKGEPVFGVVHAPALDTTYWGGREIGAFKKTSLGAHPIHVAALPTNDQRWRVVGSRSHASADFDAFMKRLPAADMVSMGSSLKLCLVAEGQADLYPRLGPTSEWDTAAAHAVVIAAGGQVLAWPSLQPLRYNQNPDSLLNPFFMVCALPDIKWAGDEASHAAGIVYERRHHDAKAEVVWHNTQVTAQMRVSAMRQTPRCIWLTGFSGSGKSTIANALELKLHQLGKHTFLLDGDNVRHGLNKDLGMSDRDRAENIRRVGELAKLMVDAGLIVVTAFISPFRQDRDQVRAMFPADAFIEVFVDTPLEECERRDPKGLYKKAREGKIKDFTGIDSPYEPPSAPEVIVYTTQMRLEECLDKVLAKIL